MPEIRPTVSNEQYLCTEIKAEPCGLVVFGASGDLTGRKLIPSLFELYRQGFLSEHFYFLGCGRKQLTDAQYRDITVDALKDFDDRDEIEKFAKMFYFLSDDYSNPQFYTSIKQRLLELDQAHGVPGYHMFYLAVPPILYSTIASNLGSAGLSYAITTCCRHQPRLIIEKPFGRDLKTSIELNAEIGKHFKESQIYRIDHYLGKETVQNILMFRFANSIFEPVWNRNYIDHVQITIAESLGIGHRGGYYDQAGAIRDMFQNHMLAMLALTAMEPPASFDANHIRDEKVKLLSSIRPIKLDEHSTDVVAGQYAAGTIEGSDVTAYCEESGVPADSLIETYVAARLFVDNWRWKDVPFYLRTGKRLKKRVTEIAITFKSVPHSMFATFGMESMPPNVLVLNIQPHEGIELSFQAKQPGPKTCMSTLNMAFSYSQIFGTKAPEAYQRLLLDAMVSDQTLFTRQDGIETAWRLLTPVLEHFQKGVTAPEKYPAGAESFPAADELIKKDHRKWRPL